MVLLTRRARDTEVKNWYQQIYEVFTGNLDLDAVYPMLIFFGRFHFRATWTVLLTVIPTSISDPSGFYYFWENTTLKQ